MSSPVLSVEAYISVSAVVVLCLSLAPIPRCTCAYLLSPTSFYWSWQKSWRNHRSTNQRHRTSNTITTSRTGKKTNRHEHLDVVKAVRDQRQVRNSHQATLNMTSLLKQDVGKTLRRQRPKATSYHSLSMPETAGRKQHSFMDLLQIFDTRNSKKRTNINSEQKDRSLLQTWIKNKDRKTASHQKAKSRLKFGPWRGKRSVNDSIKDEEDHNNDFGFKIHRVSYREVLDQVSQTSQTLNLKDHFEQTGSGEVTKRVLQIWRPECYDKNTTRGMTNLSFDSVNNSRDESLVSVKLLDTSQNYNQRYLETLEDHHRTINGAISDQSQTKMIKTELNKFSRNEKARKYQERFKQEDRNSNRVAPRVYNEKCCMQKTSSERNETSVNDIIANMKTIGFKNSERDKNNAVDRYRHKDSGFPILHKNYGKFHFAIFDREDETPQKRYFRRMKIKLLDLIRSHLRFHVRHAVRLTLSRSSQKFAIAGY